MFPLILSQMQKRPSVPLTDAKAVLRTPSHSHEIDWPTDGLYAKERMRAGSLELPRWFPTSWLQTSCVYRFRHARRKTSSLPDDGSGPFRQLSGSELLRHGGARGRVNHAPRTVLPHMGGSSRNNGLRGQRACNTTGPPYQAAGDGICTRTGPYKGVPPGSKPGASAVPPPPHLSHVQRKRGTPEYSPVRPITAATRDSILAQRLGRQSFAC